MKTGDSHDRTGNRLLDRLPPDEHRRVLAECESVIARHGQEVCGERRPAPYVVFPVEGVVSAVVAVQEGQIVEVGTVGNEGLVGLPAFLGLSVSPITYLWQVPGTAMRLRTAAFQRLLQPKTELDRLLKRYTAFTLREARQLVACNTLHSVAERACRWLLTTHDRMAGDEFLLTHEYLAEMLGVRRQSVSLVAATLQAAGLLTYRRGHVRILNRAGMEDASCECYGVLKDVYERIMH